MNAVNIYLLRKAPGLHSAIRKSSPYFLLIGALVTVAFVPSNLLIPAILVWAAFALAMLMWAHSWSRAAASKFDGRMVKYVFSPTPMGSLCAALENYGVPLDDIRNLKMMSTDLAYTKKYLSARKNDEEPFIDTVERCKDMDVSYYGYALDPNIDSGHSRIKFIRTKTKRTEHANLIHTKNHGSFVWYEPCHDNNGEKDYFGGGAYLIELTPKGVRQAERLLEDFTHFDPDKTSATEPQYA